MNIKIAGQSSKGNYRNTGSCGGAVWYNEHDLRDLPRIFQELGVRRNDLTWFDMNGNLVKGAEVIDKIGRLKSHLRKRDAKFYCMMINPSDDEAKAIGATVEEQIANGKAFVFDVMDAYAGNFNREQIKDRHDLVAFAIPHIFKSGGKQQIHWHVIQARLSRGFKVDIGEGRYRTRRYKLSPLTNHRHTVQGVICGGFDRVAFDRECERKFDERYNYDRRVENSFDYCLSQKKGTAEEKAAQEFRLAMQNLPELEESIRAAINRRKERLAREAKERAIKEQLAKEERARQEVARIERKNAKPKFSFDFKAAHQRPSAPESRSQNGSVTPVVTPTRSTVDVYSIIMAAKDKDSLERTLLYNKVVIEPIKDRFGGVADFKVTLAAEGRIINASLLISVDRMHTMLDKWEAITGDTPSYKLEIQRKNKQKLAEEICVKMDAVSPENAPRIPRAINFLPGGEIEISYTTRKGNTSTVRVDSAGKLRFNSLVLDIITGKADHQKGQLQASKQSNDDTQGQKQGSGIKRGI